MPRQSGLRPGDHLQRRHPGVAEAGGAGAHHPRAGAQLDGLAVVRGRDLQGWSPAAGSPEYLQPVKNKTVSQ